jgi:hypothetical protein
MDLIPVASSNIRAIGYDLETAILQIEFLSGMIYEYYEVPGYEYDGLMAADSKGKYANRNIYKAYRYQRVR